MNALQGSSAPALGEDRVARPAATWQGMGLRFRDGACPHESSVPVLSLFTRLSPERLQHVWLPHSLIPVRNLIPQGLMHGLGGDRGGHALGCIAACCLLS